MKTLYPLFVFLAFPFAFMAQPDIEPPHAPDLSVTWVDDHVVLSVSNIDVNSNNLQESYSAVDESAVGDSLWTFQGYMIYQVQLPFDILDIHNPDVARLVVQTDIADGITNLVNTVYDADVEQCLPVLQVQGFDGGLATDFTISSEMWTGEFVEGEIYCYIAMAYACNVNGESVSCPEMAYQFVPGFEHPSGQAIIQCVTAQGPANVAEQGVPQINPYPNPTNDWVFIPQGELIDRIVVRDVLGNVVLELDRGIAAMDLGFLENGVYLVELASKEWRQTKRITKR